MVCALKTRGPTARRQGNGVTDGDRTRIRSVTSSNVTITLTATMVPKVGVEPTLANV